MPERHHQTLTMDHVTLRVNDLDRMAHFYTEIVGLIVLSESETEVVLGVPENDSPLLILDAANAYTLVTGPRNGLYHTAFLLPTRADLGDVLYRFAATEQEMGASDHGYSEALYIQDPEDNGVEIYVDKPFDTWSFDADGHVIGTTEPIDVKGIFEAKHDVVNEQLPAGTRIGHLHLAHEDGKAFGEFYHMVMNLERQTQLGHAYWSSYDHYHHHFAVNNWNRKEMTPYATHQTGLASYRLTYTDAALYAQIIANLKDGGYLRSENDYSAEASDPNGATIHLVLASTARS